MSHFYGTLEGDRGTVSRQGSKKSGMATTCAAKEGRVTCHVYHKYKTNTDWIQVELDIWEDYHGPIVLYNGPIGEYKRKEVLCLGK